MFYFLPFKLKRREIIKIVEQHEEVEKLKNQVKHLTSESKFLKELVVTITEENFANKIKIENSIKLQQEHDEIVQGYDKKIAELNTILMIREAGNELLMQRIKRLENALRKPNGEEEFNADDILIDIEDVDIDDYDGEQYPDV